MSLIFREQLLQTKRMSLLTIPLLESMSVDCNYQMKIEATKKAIRILTGKPLQSELPHSEN